MGNGENWTKGKVPKTESTEFLCLWISKCRISASAIMKKLKNSCHFFNIDRMENFPITAPPQSLGLQFSECRQKWNISIGHYEKNWKMAAISLISIVQKNFQLPTPPKFGSLVFWVLTEMEYQSRSLWKNLKIAAISLISIVWKNFQLPTPPKVWVSSFLSVNGNWISSENQRYKFCFFWIFHWFISPHHPS